MARITSFRETGLRYPWLRISASLFAMFGALLMVVGIGVLGWAGSIFLVARGGPVEPPLKLPIWIYAVYGVCFLFGGLQQIAVAGFLRLVIHLEENTRATAQAMEAIRSRMEPGPEGSEPFFAA